MTKWLGVLAQKGGTGKSTITVHLAVEAERNGERVLVLDADPQASSLAWGQNRDAETPRVERLQDGVKNVSVGDATLVVVDFPPRASAAVAVLAEQLDYAIVPLQPSSFDMATVDTTARILRAARVKYAVVLNRAPERSIDVGNAREYLDGLEVEYAPVAIGDRRAFVRALMSGESVSEFEPRGRAAEEIANLWAFVKGNLK